MSFSVYHQQIIQRDNFTEDPFQAPAVSELARIDLALSSYVPSDSWLPWKKNKAEPITGLYLWGGVGRGKTWLVDLFYEHVSLAKKQRLHFHRFMQLVHARLKEVKGEKNPLDKVSSRMADDWRLLCIDEFVVTDIGDAVILAGLLKGLTSRGVVLITTSNVVPDQLYKDGIQRASFLPAIALLQKHTTVINLDGDKDYRQKSAQHNKVYHTPLGAGAEQAMATAFQDLADSDVKQDGELVVNNRIMPYRFASNGITWFDFEALCGPPRSQNDYIELARQHHTVFVSDIPVMGGSRDDRTRRFIFLIDEFYDRKIHLVISAEASVERLYIGERLAFEFQRTQSRLIEMQSESFLTRDIS